MITKKTGMLCAFLLSIILAASSTVTVFAAPNMISYKLTYDGKEHNYSNYPITLVINGKTTSNLPMNPVILNNCTYVPVREVYEQMQASVEWFDATKTVNIYYKGDVIALKMDSMQITKNGVVSQMPAPMKIINNKAMIPIRATAELLGFLVEWDDVNKIASISDTALLNDNNTSAQNTEQTTNGPVVVEPTYTAQERPLVIAEGPPIQPKAPDDPYIIPAEESAIDISETVILPKSVPETQITNILLPNLGNPNTYVIEASSEITAVDKQLLADNRLIIDILNSETKLANSSIDINSIFISKIRSSQFAITEQKITRVVFDLTRSVCYSVSLSEDRRRILVTVKANPDSNVPLTATPVPTTPIPATPATLAQGSISYNNASKTFTIPKVTSGLSAQSLTHVDEYLNLQYKLLFNCDATNAFLQNSAFAEDEYIKSFNVSSVNGQTQLLINEKKILAYIVTEDAANIYVKAVLPKEKYAKIVVLDPGHGGYEPGSVQNGLYEKEQVLDISKRVLAELERDTDIKVYATRLTDVFVSLEARAAMGNELGDLFVSVHLNSFTSPSPTGTEVYYYDKVDNQYTGGKSKTIAQYFQQNLVSSLGTNDRKIKSNNYVVLRESRIPAVLCEVAFISNPGEAARVKTDAFKSAAGSAIAQGIVESFNVVNHR